MIYRFKLDEYWDIMDAINDRSDVDGYGFKQIKVCENGESELYAFGYRIFIPELNMTVRFGMEYYEGEEEEEQLDSFLLYEGDETNPEEFYDSYCNTDFPTLIEMIAKSRGVNNNPVCIIDDSEFEFEVSME